MKRVFLCCALLLAGCGDVGSSPQIVITLNATPSAAAVGDTITFTVGATASTLASVSMSYGDSATETYNTPGLSTVQATFKHVYAAAGTYHVQATATDARAATRSTGFTVSIQ